MSKRAERVASLSRRERQVMDILFRRGDVTVALLMADMTDPPTNPAVRSILRILLKKRLINRRKEGTRYVYLPAVDPSRVRERALKHLMHTFFNGSVEQVVAAAISTSEGLEPDEIARIQEHISRARKHGR